MSKTLIDREKLIEEMKDYLGCGDECCNGCDNEKICFSKILYEQPEVLFIKDSKPVYAIKNSNAEYFIGYGKWDKQIRKAKLYHATNWAEEVMNDPRFNGLDLKVVKVIIYEEE